MCAQSLAAQLVTLVATRCRSTVQLFRAEAEQIVNEQSFARRKLNYLTLVFSHLLAELRAVMPAGRLLTDFVIAKIEARKFWRENFGSR